MTNNIDIQEFTLTVFTENQVGLLSRVVGLITRRKYNIESLTVSKSSIPGIHRFTIVLLTQEETVRKICEMIEKQVDVLKAYYDTNDKIVYQEIALYKVDTNGFYNSQILESLIRQHNARIIDIEPEYIVVQKTGHQEETENLLHALKPYGVYEFVRSGRIAIIKEMERLNKYLKNIEIEQKS